MHCLPPQCDYRRSLFDVERDLVPIGTGEREAPRFDFAAASARTAMDDDKSIVAVHSICNTQGDNLCLVKFSRDRSYFVVWNFTTGDIV